MNLKWNERICCCCLKTFSKKSIYMRLSFTLVECVFTWQTNRNKWRSMCWTETNGQAKVRRLKRSTISLSKFVSFCFQSFSYLHSMPERLYMPWNNSDLSRFTTTRNSSRHPTVYNCIVRRKSLTRTQRLVFLFCFIRHLQDNLIKRIRRDGTFRRLRSLRTLYVFSNEISSSSECLFVDRDLRNNQLEEIDDDAFDGADSLNEL